MKKALIFIFGIILFVSCEKDDELDQSKIPNDYVAMFLLDGNADDNSKYKNHGEIVGNVVPTSNRNGIENSAMFFDNEISYINVENADELELTNSISISVWVKADSLQYGWNTIVNKWANNWGPAPGGQGYYLGINTHGLNLRWNISNNILELDSPFPLNTWSHIVVTYNGLALKMYLNGKFIDEYPFEGGIADNDVPFRIGHQSEIIHGTANFHGAIDDVLIYDRALEEVEIDILFNENY